MTPIETIRHRYRGTTIQEDRWPEGETTYIVMALGGADALSVDDGKRIIDEHYARYPQHETDDGGNYVVEIPRDMFGIPQ